MAIGRYLAGALAVATLAGCAPTWATGTAVSPDPNLIYVTGRRGNPAALWLCPARKTGQQCQPVRVVVSR